MSSSTSSSESGVRTHPSQRARGSGVPTGLVRKPWALWWTLALLALLEVGFRLHDFGLPGVMTPWRYTGSQLRFTDLVVPAQDAAVPYTFKAGASGFFKGAPLTTNSLGFRGPEVSLDKPPGVTRIAVLGASETLGSGVADDETYSSQLQQLLDRSHSGEYQVLNFAVGGYTLQEQIAAYEAGQWRFDPDIIMIRMHHLMLRGRGMDPERRRTPRLTELRPRLEIFLAYRAARWWFREKLHRRLATDWELQATRSDSEKPEDVQRLLGRFAAAQAREGVQVVLAFLPKLRDAQSEDQSDVERSMAWFRRWAAKRANIDIIDTYPALAGCISLEDRIYFGDSHPNARAHRAFALALYADLKPMLERRSGRASDLTPPFTPRPVHRRATSR